MFGGPCEYGPDQNRQGHGISLLAFDFERETIVMRTLFQLPQEKLPPAFAPLDAKMRFSDVSRRGIHVVEERRGALWRVVVTVSMRRPPKFSAPFEQACYSSNGERIWKRRATLMDFVLCDVVSSKIAFLC